MADPLPLCAFFPHDLRVKISLYGKSADLNQLDHHRQARNRTLILNVGKIPPFNPNHFCQCFSCQTLCLSCDFDIRTEGMKQRLAIALAVMHDPELLILDEPINGLDPIGIAEVRSFIRELCDARGKTILISSHILSEISLLADDIGIIDHGALLEEESLAELEQKSSKHIRFTLSDTAQAARILERNFHETHFSIQDDHNLRLHNLDLPVGKIVTAFVENGLEVSEAATSEESLEDYFKRVTGGEGIA